MRHEVAEYFVKTAAGVLASSGHRTGHKLIQMTRRGAGHTNPWATAP
jgi:hypothetical protein